MTTRTSTKLILFNHPFTIGPSEEIQPAGYYQVDTDEELIQGLSFIAYKRVMMVIHLHSKSKTASLTRALTITAKDLEKALQKDKEADETIIEDFKVRQSSRG